MIGTAPFWSLASLVLSGLVLYALVRYGQEGIDDQ